MALSIAVGGAVGTIAKTISAYDMAFSDAIYGACGRCVSRARLDTMLAHETVHLSDRPDALTAGLTDDLDASRINVDMVRFSGPACPVIDKRIMSLQLVVQRSLRMRCQCSRAKHTGLPARYVNHFRCGIAQPGKVGRRFFFTSWANGSVFCTPSE